MMQLLLYTDLRIDGQTARYKLYYDPAERRYFYKPEEVTLRFPSFYLWKQQGHWVFAGISDTDLQAEAAAAAEGALANREPLM